MAEDLQAFDVWKDKDGSLLKILDKWKYSGWIISQIVPIKYSVGEISGSMTLVEALIICSK